MRSLHVRLACLLAGLLALLTAGLVAGGLWSAERHGAHVRQLLNRDVAAHVAKDLRPFVDGGVDVAALKALFMRVMVVNPALEVYLLDEDGRVLAYDAPDEKIVRRRVDLGPVRRFLGGTSDRLVEGDDPREVRGTKPFTAAEVAGPDGRRGYLYMIVGGEERDSAAASLGRSDVTRMLLLGALGLAGVTLAAGAFAFAKLTRPLRHLRDEVAAFREDEPHVPIAVRGGADEIRQLARAYDELTARVVDCVGRLERTDRKRREFVANVSHDLRTPLASLEGYLELLRGRPDLPADERTEYLEAAGRRARQLTRLVDQLFELARLEAKDVPLTLEEFCPAELAQDVLQAQRPAAGRRGVKLVCRLSRELPAVRADIGLIERALDNLLSNATRHTPRGGTVELAVRRRAGRVEFGVRDTGAGIRRQDLPRVFERAFQRAPSDGGAGLGLAITRRIVHLHGETIDVASREGQGAHFRFGLRPV